MEIPQNLKLADKQTSYKVWACEKCKIECTAVPVEPDASTGKPSKIIVVCAGCLSGFVTTFEDFQKTMKG